MRAFNLGLRFALELCMLAALAGWGFSKTAVLGVATPVAAAAVWGLWVAPKAKRRLSDPARLAVELFLFGAAAVLAAAGHGLLAVLFAAAVAVNEILELAWRQRDVA